MSTQRLAIAVIWAQFPSDAAHAFPAGSNAWAVSLCGRINLERVRAITFPEMDGVRCAECVRRLERDA